MRNIQEGPLKQHFERSAPSENNVRDMGNSSRTALEVFLLINGGTLPV